jgi:hypothetical protein
MLLLGGTRRALAVSAKSQDVENAKTYSCCNRRLCLETRPRPDWQATGCLETGQSSEAVFLFFSNRIGCLGSIVISVALTVLLLFLFGVL